MNYYNSETLLEQQQEIEKLKEQNAALAAQVGALRGELDGLVSAVFKTSKALIEATETLETELLPALEDKEPLVELIEEFKAVVASTPQQHLAEIRAQVVIEFASFIYRQFENGEYHRLARHKFQQLNSRAQGQTASIHNDVEYCGILGNAEFYAAKVQQGGE